MSGNIIQLNEDLIKNNLKDLVRSSVEETLNALLDHEAEELVRAGKYERNTDRQGYRSGHYDRHFTTTSSEVKFHIRTIGRPNGSIEKGIKRRTKAIGAFPDGNSVLMLVFARLRYVAASSWGTKKYLNMDHLFQQEWIQQTEKVELIVYNIFRKFIS